MKRLLCLVSLLFIVIGLYAQKIKSDEYMSDGARVVTTSVERVSGINKRFVLWIGLSACVHNGVTTYSIQAEYTGAYKMSVNDESALLLKTFNNEIINLKTYVTPYSYFSGHSWTETSRIGSYISNIEHLNKFYVIDNDDLSKVIKNGICKVRCQIDVKGESIHDKEFKHDEIGSIISECFSVLNERLKTTPTKKDIMDGF